ncbi:hypothetical protein AMS68_007318 [Peltaster fructicola]|uniref:Integral membrane protein n=1 Tax=Peltaster fructicola TaxID=286661 RepID=A0A6H0Y4F6_9PEZI|nr:hypothetical protein AMS68_007318 [Peltaster fructicola]
MNSPHDSEYRLTSPGRRRNDTTSTGPPSRRANAPPIRAPLTSNNSSIRIRRLTSASSRNTDITTSDNESIGGDSLTDDPAITGRRRSSSAPQRMTHLPGHTNDLHGVTTNEYHPDMPAIAEGAASGAMPATNTDETGHLQPPRTATRNKMRPRGLSDLHTAGSGMQAAFGAGNAARANRGLTRMRSHTVRSRPPTAATDEYDERVLGLLDLVDPEVQTLGTLTNVQNSLFVPDLGRLLNRRPTYDLTSRPSTARLASAVDLTSRSRGDTLRSRADTASTLPRPSTVQEHSGEETKVSGRRASISSQLTESHWAVLPHGETLEGWTDEDVEQLNDHVRHLLHSRREGFKRSWRGFKKYVSKPLGLFVTVYAVLVTLFGATWVIFLIGWIYVGTDRQPYAINVIDNVLVALFALIGDGMAPFRAVDTYHMCFIAHYHHLTWRLRREKEMPKLQDHNDLPARQLSADELDVEAGETVDDIADREEFSVLSPRQQKRLQYHQAKFSKSHTFYKPHETSTHHAFPLRLLVAVVVLLDCHSLFQVALGTCTWSIDYQIRPQALTATILSCSITCNIVAGVLVSIGDKRTRKKEVLDKLFRQALTKEAIHKIQKRQSEHDRHNYEAIEEEFGQPPVPQINKLSEDLVQPLRRRKEILERTPRITKNIPRVSREMPRLSKDLSEYAANFKSA